MRENKERRESALFCQGCQGKACGKECLEGINLEGNSLEGINLEGNSREENYLEENNLLENSLEDNKLLGKNLPERCASCAGCNKCKFGQLQEIYASGYDYEDTELVFSSEQLENR